MQTGTPTTQSTHEPLKAKVSVAPTPHSTYRLQLTPSFTLHEAVGWIDYLHQLGADWVYCSPLLQAQPGSEHGYDVIGHSRTDSARGGREGLAALANAAHAVEMGLLVDIVPNHVGITTPVGSVWWRDVLAQGRRSTYASAFDIDWAAGDGKLLLPLLGDGPNELDALRIEGDMQGGVNGGRLCYYDHVFPIAVGSCHPGDSDSPQQVHDRQHYRLVNFRRADRDLNYRRFFAVDSLAAIRVQDARVFTDSHQEIQHWLEAGWIDGLRVDHPDGLADPASYLHTLSAIAGGRYIVVEKILGSGEALPTNWCCAGTTGYDTLAAIDRVLVNPAAEATLDALDGQLRGRTVCWPDMVHHSKRAVADGILNSEVRWLARLVPDLASPDQLIDALAELLACFPVYRSYLPTGADYLKQASNDAAERRPELAPIIAALVEHAQTTRSEFTARLQQSSAAIMAKGVEDCAFYRYPRLVSLTEVGGSPDIFALTPEEFHETERMRLATWPNGMTTLSTHDTKRGEDVRARINVLSEVADDWALAVTRWLEHTHFPDKILGNLLLQTALGAWPVESDRLHAYAEKAAREAGQSTGWVDRNAAFETQLHALVDACYEDRVIADELTGFAERIRPAGWSNALSAKLIQLSLPGVPDIYRGTELWENSLVDPDNRRPFDALTRGGAAELLSQLDAGWLPPIDNSGAAKLLVVSRTLRARRDRPELFHGYTPLNASGPAARHLLGFNRGGAVTLATRLPVGLETKGGWGNTHLELPAGQWQDALTGNQYGTEHVAAPTISRPNAPPGTGSQSNDDDATSVQDSTRKRISIDVTRLLARYPVALLLRCHNESAGQ